MLNSLLPPDGDHWFGTDQLGRDVFSRVIAGARDILTVAPLATLISTVLGTALGLVMGYFGGWVDEIVSRLVDAVLALPTVIVALLALTALGTSTVTVLFVIGWFASGGDAPDYGASDADWVNWADDNQWKSRIGAFAMLLAAFVFLHFAATIRTSTRVW